MENSILCSIIIPHHNLVDLLQRSLTTIPDRPDFEVIVVDDNSDEKSLSELKALRLNSNVKVIYTSEGKGAGYARNKGIEAANGKWVLFCDSDDFFTIDMPALVNEYADSDFDTVFFGFKTVNNETLQLMTSRVVGSNKALEKKDIDFFKYRFHGPWAKLVQRRLLIEHNIRCDEVICSNDTFLAGLIGYYANNCIVDKREIYVTTIRQGSLVHSMNEYSLITRIDVSLRYNRFLNKINKNKYRINMIGLLFYLKNINKPLFFTYLKVFLKDESIWNIWRDFTKSTSGFLKQKFVKSENLRKQIKIYK